MEYQKLNKHQLLPVIEHLKFLRTTTTNEKEKRSINKQIHKYQSWINRHNRLYLSKEKQNDQKSP